METSARSLRVLLAAALAISVSSTPSVLAAPASGPPDAAFERGDVRPGLGASILDPAAIVERAIQNQTDRTRAEASELRVESVRTTPLGVSVRGRQYREDVPIDGTWLVALVSKGRLTRMSSKTTPLRGQPTRSPLESATAIDAALEGLEVSALVAEPRAERLMVADQRRLVDVWRVSILARNPALAAQVDVSTTEGAIVGRRDPAHYEDTSATVFDPNPIVALEDNSIRQPGVDYLGFDTDLDEARLTSALTTLPIRQADTAGYPSGILRGPFADVQGPAALVTGPDGFSFTRGDPRFETTMAYAHIDRLQRYFHSLGLEDVNSEPQNVYAVPIPGYDNSFYLGGFDMIVLGSGGVDDGEDAEVILHEYGHAIQDDQVAGWSNSGETGAMGEGFGDFLAASYFATVSSKGFGDLCIAEWDATTYSRTDPPCLRRLDSGKRYPKDMEREVHADGEIWSAFLWKLRHALGDSETTRSTNSLALVLNSHTLLPPDAGFLDAVSALKATARLMGRSGWVKHISQAASAHGMGKS